MSSPIFISHSSRDRDWAYRLINDLEKRGVACWISSRDIEPGADYQKSIVDALEAAPAMVLLFSDHANNSKEIPREMAIASGKSKPMIPVRIEDVVPRNALEYSLTNAQFLDLFANYEETMTRLTESLLRQIAASKLNVSSAKPAAVVDKPASAQPKSGKGPTIPPRAEKPQSLPLKPKSNNKVYMGVGAVALLAVAGVFVFTSQDDATQVQTVQSIPAPQAASPVAKPAPASVEQPPKNEAKKVTPPPAPAVEKAPEKEATPAVSVAPEESEAAGGIDALVASAKQLRASDRVEALQKSPLIESQKISAGQMLSLLSGTSNSERSRLIERLLPFTAQPIVVADALKLLNLTGDSWDSTVITLNPALPDNLKDEEILALLGTTASSSRARVLESLAPKGVAPFDMTVVEKILRPMNDSRSSAIRTLVNLLPQPLPEDSFNMLLTSLNGSTRNNTIEAMQPVLANTLTLSGSLKLLENTNDSWTSALSTLSPRLPENLTAAEGAQLLGRTQNSSRSRSLETVAPHLAPGLKGSDAESMLRGMNDSWYSGVYSLVPRLAKAQDNASILTLLGTTKNSTRNRTIEALATVLPAKISVDDAVSMLDGTGDSRLSTAIFLLPYLPRLSQQDLDNLAGNISTSDRQRLVEATKR